MKLFGDTDRFLTWYHAGGKPESHFVGLWLKAADGAATAAGVAAGLAAFLATHNLIAGFAACGVVYLPLRRLLAYRVWLMIERRTGRGGRP